MSDEPGFDDVRASMRELVAHLRMVVAQREDAAQWFAMWGPVIAALGRLGFRLSQVAFRLKDVALGGRGSFSLGQYALGDASSEPEEVLLAAEDREAFVEELRSLADDFPDVVEVLFGLRHLDELVETMMHDESTRSAARKVGVLFTRVTDRLVRKFVDIALGNAADHVGPEEILGFVQRFEDVAQDLLDRWVPRGLGMVSSVIYEEE